MKIADSRRLLWVSVALLILICGVAYYFFMPVAQVAVVRRGTAISAVYGTVRIEPAFVVHVRAQNSGFIQLAEEFSAGRGAVGKSVTKGQLLATIADETTARQLKQARTDLQAATERAKLPLPSEELLKAAEDNLHRLEQVVATGNVPAVEYEKARSEANRLRGALENERIERPTKTSVRLRSGIQCDLRVVSSTEYPFALHYFTGSKEHNIEMRSRALARGWTLNEYRLAKLPPDPKASKKKKLPAKKIPKVNDEADLYNALGLDFIPPELRETCGEFEAAEKHSLPKLIEKENLRGTFHCHTVASDGHNTLEEMAAAAQELGLEYLGIAEHSKSSMQAHGIDAAKLKAQVAAIRKLNKKLDGFRLFAGVECDILRDGKLDFSDEVLAELDFVVASIHSVFNLSEADMTKRVIRAMENRFVTILGHPTGRSLLKREPYSIDIPAVIDAAAATGTWIELNAAPKRLDLDWRWWPLAKQKGVKCIIDPDAHRAERLQDLWFGVGIARKGWLTKADVMNCLTLGKIETALQAKRNET